MAVAAEAFFLGRGGALAAPFASVMAALAVFTVLPLAGLFYLVEVRCAKVEFVFAYCAVLAFAVELFAIPLFNTPDEVAHYYRAYQVSQGVLFSAVDEASNAVGGPLPSYCTIPAALYENVFAHKLWVQASLPVNLAGPEEVSFFIFPNTALYAPGTYAPQALGMFLIRLFTTDFLAVAYAGRLFNWLVASAILFFCIRHVSVGKRLLFVIALLPMVQQGFNSLSADAFSFALCVAIVCFALHWRFADRQLRVRDYALMAVLVFFLVQCKVVYAPLCLVLFLIPQERFGSRARYITAIVLVAALGLVTCLYFLGASSSLLLGEDLNEGVNASAQIAHILANPLGYVMVLARTFVSTLNFCIQSATANYLGPAFDITITPLLAYVYVLLVLWCVFFDDEMSVKVGKAARIMLIALVLVIALLVLTSLYLQWTRVGEPVVAGVQGRYFLPLAFPLLVAIMPSRVRANHPGKNAHHDVRFCPGDSHARYIFALSWGLFMIVVANMFAVVL